MYSLHLCIVGRVKKCHAEEGKLTIGFLEHVLHVNYHRLSRQPIDPHYPTKSCGPSRHEVVAKNKISSGNKLLLLLLLKKSSSCPTEPSGWWVKSLLGKRFDYYKTIQFSSPETKTSRSFLDWSQSQVNPSTSFSLVGSTSTSQFIQSMSSSSWNGIMA